MPNSFAKYSLFLLIAVLLSACSATEHLKEGEYLLKSEVSFKRAETVSVADTLLRGKIFQGLRILGNSSLDSDLLASGIRTRPNRRMLIPKTYLHLWSLGKSIDTYEYPLERLYHFLVPNGNLEDTIANFLINVAGEAPVLVDTAQLNADVENLKSVYFSRGYFHPEIVYEIDTLRNGRSKKANVTFLIDENEVTIIDTVEYVIPDAGLRRAVENVRKDSYLKPGDPYNEENFNKERNRLSKALRNRGFFNFSPSRISFVVDTTWSEKNRKPNDSRFRKYETLRIRMDILAEQKLYHIRGVIMQIEPTRIYPDDLPYIIYPGVVPDEIRENLKLSPRVLNDSNWVTFRAYQRAIKGLNLNFLRKQLAVKPGEIYSQVNEQKTQRRLQELGIFRFITIRHSLIDSTEEVDIIIETSMNRKYQLKVGLEGFTTQNSQLQQNNLPGFGGELTFLDKKLFKGAEFLKLTGRGNVSFYVPGEGENIRGFFEIGLDASLNIPRIMFPFLANRSLARFNPTTRLSLSFEEQNRIEFDRTVLTADWNYSWFHSSQNRRTRSSLSPLRVNLIRATLTDAYQQAIDNIQNDFLRALIVQDYEPRFSSRMGYTFTHSDYREQRQTATHFVQTVAESGGNLPYLIDRFSNFDNDIKDHQLGPLFYGQYFKATVEYKTYVPVSKNSELVYRVYTGLADPWNYTTKVPFDARFFAGGTNSMRGWQSNTLGPGIFNEDREEDLSGVEYLVSPGGEFIFETNLEYRFNLNSYIELALFTDIGNVWFLPSGGFEFDDGKLSLNTFRPGWDAGLGIRFDFSFFVFRIDGAQQLFDPKLLTATTPFKSGFVLGGGLKKLGGNNFQYNFGIGYPF